jgi:phosphate transport system substrate-binding protein
MRALVCLLFLCVAGFGSVEAQLLKINGSTTVKLPVAEAAEMLRAEQGMQIHVDTQGGSSGGISMLREGLVQIGMSSKSLTDGDRKKFPNVKFQPIRIGEDAVALIVSKDVWEAGVRSLSVEQMRGIYEGKVTNWKQVGGLDRRIAFFNKEPGRGTWEVFANWAYGSAAAAPPASPSTSSTTSTSTTIPAVCWPIPTRRAA